MCNKLKQLFEINFSSKMSLNSSTSGGNSNALENIEVLKKGIKVSDVFCDNEVVFSFKYQIFRIRVNDTVTQNQPN